MLRFPRRGGSNELMARAEALIRDTSKTVERTQILVRHSQQLIGECRRQLESRLWKCD